MGDSGSMLIGLVLSASARHPDRPVLRPTRSARARPARRPACCRRCCRCCCRSRSWSSRSLDLVLAVVRRTRAGRSPFAPGQAAPAPPAARDRPLPPARGADHVDVGRRWSPSAPCWSASTAGPWMWSALAAMAVADGRADLPAAEAAPARAARPPGRDERRAAEPDGPGRFDRSDSSPSDFVLVFTSAPDTSERSTDSPRRTAADMTTEPRPAPRTRGPRCARAAAVATAAWVCWSPSLGALVSAAPRRPRRARRHASWSWRVFGFGTFTVNAVAAVMPAAALLVAAADLHAQVVVMALAFVALVRLRRRSTTTIDRAGSAAPSSPARWCGSWCRSCRRRAADPGLRPLAARRRPAPARGRRGRAMTKPDCYSPVRNESAGTVGWTSGRGPEGRPVARVRVHRLGGRDLRLPGVARGPMARDGVRRRDRHHLRGGLGIYLTFSRFNRAQTVRPEVEENR